MPEVTRPDIDAIEARADAATPGPWDVAMDCVTAPTCGEILRITGWPEVGDVDAEFIAHAREDVPDLLAYVRDLEAKLRRWRCILETTTLLSCRYHDHALDECPIELAQKELEAEHA